MTKHCRNCRNNIPNTGGCRCRCHPQDINRIIYYQEGY